MNAIVVGRRGLLRDGIIALLYTVPEFRVVSATEEPESAIELIEDQRSTLVILSVEQPSRGCDESVKAIRERAPSTRTLAMVNDAESRSQCLAAGVDRVFMQGSSIDTLRDTIIELVGSYSKDSSGTDSA